MKKAAYTPGPWRLDSGCESAPGYIGISSPDGPRRHYGLAQVVVEIECEAYPEGEANASLVAAAPELLEALRGCLAYRNWQLAKGGEVPDELRDVWKNAETALAKARGGEIERS
jgi:hypothetical protein